MDEIEKRLAACFSMVLPELAPAEIGRASVTSVESWDSVATVTLLVVVEEEFGINIDVEDPARFNSFKSILTFLQQAAMRGHISNGCGLE
jgi:acyl carrier protein